MRGSDNCIVTGNARTPGLSPKLPQWIQEAWLLASVDYGAAQVRSGHLLLALLAGGVVATSPKPSQAPLHPSVTLLPNDATVQSKSYVS